MILKVDKVVLAIGSIVLLEILALSQGINGTTLSLSIAAIAGLGGYEMHDVIKTLKGGEPPLTPK